MIGPLGRRFKKLHRSYQKRRDKLAEKRLAAGVSVAKKFGLLTRKDSVLFVGYAEAALGLAQSFRNMLTALDSAGMQFSIYPFNKGAETRSIGPFLERRYDRTGVFDVNVAYMEVNQLPHYFLELRKQVTSARYNILRTYWELAEAPPAWRTLLERIDELWVPNSFVADAFRPIFDRAITVIPVCINVDRKRSYGREHFGLDDGRFTFLFSFDYYSGSARKNPLGVVQAFQYAFPNPETKVGLLIKSTGPKELDATASQQLENLSTLDGRITILDQSLSRDEMLSLIDDCDCYISLHRSEGFGLGMAEALALRKPVIATDYSGSRDFLSADTGFPVPFSLRRLMPGEYLMGDGRSWAEPDLRAAIQHMQVVFADQKERQTRAASGEQYIREHYSGQTIAKIIENRLDEIRRGKRFPKKHSFR
jgi:glycosyltransferase involved in cell wall biosynthesis